MTFPKVFEDFCKANGIDPIIYETPQKQFFFSKSLISGDAVEEEGRAIACPELDGFYQITAEAGFQFSKSRLYRSGLLLPMDLNSGLAVSLLDLKPSDHVLDLCCAPGGKMVLVGLIQGPGDFREPESIGTVTGVDLSSHRLAICRSLIKKYRIERARLFCCDGTRFAEPPREFVQRPSEEDGERTPCFHESTAFRKRPNRPIPSGHYDKILVDAQCTHDGSIKHIRKHRDNNWEGFDLSQFEAENLESLHCLQFNLLEAGFKLLKAGGIIVYSTCSLSRGQNEDVVTKFLKKWDGKVKPLPFPQSDALGQMRMSPPRDDSGFFICRLQKL